MPKRQVFFSFRYAYDAWRASQVRNMGLVTDEPHFSDNSWEEVREKSVDKVHEWIDKEMKYRSCVVLLIGEHTQGRPYINYEIEQAWKQGKGIVGIYVHGLKDQNGRKANKGANPLSMFCIDRFDGTIHFREPLYSCELFLSSVVKTYDPTSPFSDDTYNYISKNIESWIEEAIQIRNRYPK